jgi:hypothetical protein
MGPGRVSRSQAEIVESELSKSVFNPGQETRATNVEIVAQVRVLHQEPAMRIDQTPITREAIVALTSAEKQQSPDALLPLRLHSNRGDRGSGGRSTLLSRRPPPPNVWSCPNVVAAEGVVLTLKDLATFQSRHWRLTSSCCCGSAYDQSLRSNSRIRRAWPMSQLDYMRCLRCDALLPLIPRQRPLPQTSRQFWVGPMD